MRSWLVGVQGRRLGCPINVPTKPDRREPTVSVEGAPSAIGPASDGLLLAPTGPLSDVERGLILPCRGPAYELDRNRCHR